MFTTKHFLQNSILRYSCRRSFAQRQNPFNIAYSADKVKMDKSKTPLDLFSKEQMAASRMTI